MPKPSAGRRLMMSLGRKEATYGAGVTMNDANADEMHGFDSEPAKWDDDVISDQGTITGNELATTQEIFQQKVMLTYSEPRARPNSLAGLAALVLGSVTSVQDGALVAYRHKIVPIGINSPLPTIQAEEIFGGIQKAYKGVIGKSLSIEAEEGGFIKLTAELEGNGSRANSATAFAAKVSESWLKVRDALVWLEDGANISIDATPTQGLENISSATPTSLAIRLKRFSLKWDNKVFLHPGFGGAGLYQEADKGSPREPSFTASLYFEDETERDFYLNQTRLAFECDLKMGTAPIAGGGTFYYGMDLIIPAWQIKKATPTGPVNEWCGLDLEGTIMADGVNDPVILYVYNAQPAYLA